jgi:hypothetical protein
MPVRVRARASRPWPNGVGSDVDLLRRALVLGVGCLLASAVEAQLWPAANVVNGAVVAGGVAAPLPAPNVPAWGALVLPAASGGCVANAALVHTIADTEVRATWTLLGRAMGGGSTPVPSTADLELRYEFWSAFAQPLRLDVAWSLQLHGTGTALLRVDVGDDGVVDATGAASLQIAPSAGPVVVRVRAAANAQSFTQAGPFGSSWTWTGEAAATLDLRLAPAHAVVGVAAAATCPAAPSLTAAPDFAHGVVFAADAPTHDLVVLALGLSPAALPLPWSPGCVLALDPIVSPWGPGQPGTFQVVVPPAVRPAAFRAQAVGVALGAPTLSASRALVIVLP